MQENDIYPNSFRSVVSTERFFDDFRPFSGLDNSFNKKPKKIAKTRKSRRRKTKKRKSSRRSQLKRSDSDSTNMRDGDPNWSISVGYGRSRGPITDAIRNKLVSGCSAKKVYRRYGAINSTVYRVAGERCHKPEK